MRYIVANIVKTSLVVIIVAFGTIWLTQPTVGVARTEPVIRSSSHSYVSYATNQQIETPTPFDEPPIQTATSTPIEPFQTPTDAPFFPTEDLDATPTPYYTEQPFPTDDPYPPFPTWEPYPFPTDSPFPTAEPYPPFPTDDPYPPYPFPSPSLTSTPMGTVVPPTATHQPSAIPSATPTRTTRPRDDDVPALIVVAQRPYPNRVASRSNIDFDVRADAPPSVANDGIVDYVISVTNYGVGQASNVAVTMPYASDLLSILDATFSDDGAHVSRIITGTTTAVEFHTGPLAPSDSVTASLRLLVRPSAPEGASLSHRVTFTWTDEGNGGAGISNLPLLVVGDADRDEPFYPLVVSPVSAPASVQRNISANVFVPYEPVALWYNAPEGSAVAIGTVQADANGSIITMFDNSALVEGQYTLVARGIRSNITSAAPLTVLP